MEWLLFIAGIWVLSAIYNAYKDRRKSTPIRLVNRASVIGQDTADSTASSMRCKSVSGDSVPIELNADFRLALTAIDSRQHNIFITGRAGSGKSTLLRHLIETCRRKCAVVAPTGLAAINVGGQTIHSFFKLPPRFIDSREIRARKEAGLLKALDLLVVDEVSMVRADLMDGIDAALRINRRDNRAFGGVQVVMFGDLWQLPPIVSEAEVKEYFDRNYGGPYFFQAHVWEHAKARFVELHKVYRQAGDQEFLEILQAVREGSNLSATLGRLNANVKPLDTLENQLSTLVLTATNDAAFQVNSSRLTSLRGRERTFSCKVSGKFDEKLYPTDGDLRLKVGAKVLFVKNDAEKRWVNGSWGVVSELHQSAVTVQMANGAKHRVEPMTWENSTYTYNRSENRIERQVVGSFVQLPLRLGWAITIHKSQGQTFERVHIDLGNGAFSHGQTYVALSRCRTLKGVTLQRQIEHKDIIVDRSVGKFRDVFSAAQ